MAKATGNVSPLFSRRDEEIALTKIAKAEALETLQRHVGGVYDGLRLLQDGLSVLRKSVEASGADRLGLMSFSIEAMKEVAESVALRMDVVRNATCGEGD